MRIFYNISKKISDEQNSKINKEISEEEVLAAIWSLHPDKASRLDEFTIAFYRQHWNIIKKDFMRMTKNVFKQKNGRKYKIFIFDSHP